jgi:hypothetical protein
MVQDLMFQQMQKLADPTIDLDKEIKRSQALSAAGTVIINSCKVQIDAVRIDIAQKKASGEGKPKSGAAIHKIGDASAPLKEIGNG